MKTIARNRTKHIEKIFANATDIKICDPVNGDRVMGDAGVMSAVNFLRSDFENFKTARLVDCGDRNFQLIINPADKTKWRYTFRSPSPS